MAEWKPDPVVERAAGIIGLLGLGLIGAAIVGFVLMVVLS